MQIFQSQAPQELLVHLVIRNNREANLDMIPTLPWPTKANVTRPRTFDTPKAQQRPNSTLTASKTLDHEQAWRNNSPVSRQATSKRRKTGASKRENS